MAKRALPRPRIGWPLLPFPDADGRMAFPTLEESVRHSMQIILQTRPGELLMHPEFGAGLTNFLHEPNTVATKRRIRDLVKQSITRWENRVLLDRVEIWDVPDRPTEILIEIGYRLRRTGATQEMRATLRLES